MQIYQNFSGFIICQFELGSTITKMARSPSLTGATGEAFRKQTWKQSKEII